MSIVEGTPVIEIPLSDSGNADYFVRDIDGDLKYDHTARRWYQFDGHWGVDDHEEVRQRAIQIIRSRHHEASLIADPDCRKAAVRFALRSEDLRPILAMLEIAKSHPSIAADATMWDRHPMLFGVQNGVLDLERGVLRGAVRADYITKVSPVAYDPHAVAPRFEQFLKEVFRSADDIIPWLQRALGYCLTGLTCEQMFWLWWGTGSNGKSTLLRLLFDLFGQTGPTAHAWTIPFPSADWTTTISEYQRAELPGRRLVAASEVRRRAPLHEDFIKSLTGGDAVNARQPYGRPFTFTPICKLVLLCNERPIIRDTSFSMWRRVRLIPFVETFAADEMLATVLASEAAGVLTWLVQGCRDWQRDGLREAPAAVLAATEDYRAASDPLVDFYDDRCVILENATAGAGQLHAAYKQWCEDTRLAREERLGHKLFGQRVRERFEAVEGGRIVFFKGIGLRTTAPDEADR